MADLANDTPIRTPVLDRSSFPENFRDVDHLESYLATPTPECVADLAAVDGDIMLLGVSGKLGLTLAWLIKRAAPGKRVIGVSRFSAKGSRDWLEERGIETVSADLLDREQVRALPRVPNVVFLAGRKFDTQGREDAMWATNVVVPALAGDFFTDSRIVALSSVHVYPWSDPLRGGTGESVPPAPRIGEYANSVVGRERVLQYFSSLHGNPGRIVRFAYSVEPRYGVMQEIADWVLRRRPIPLETGTVNLLWQGDALNQFARLLRHCTAPTTPINIGAPETVSVRALAEYFGRIYDVEPVFSGRETDCLVVNCELAAETLGNPVVPVRTMANWVAEWVGSGKPILGKPSKFESRAGAF
ncbi:NAD(P)-dependent oxidoreductase [Amycolatopsis rhabdoformis]|uniref:NAD(P)-dependent oxidoreductase n=1 Tax=Amycolatopsis rhabdoformis TaxID=1448059 RepID=A0ABZ1IJJ6_9PSEU|nr:NAD(P)-dependent oxidoreductase [Amycolatopsis rhabdoformis]WSE34576.1 NAD(P)-dependent oxidoreductase [Amycolatopsis rhabdoformis]